MAALPGSRLGPYEIAEPLGAGGMGEVYRARDTRLNRTVADKILPAELAADPDRATFRNPLTGADIKQRIRSMMRLDQ
jgi:serine/threonine protein kinase